MEGLIRLTRLLHLASERKERTYLEYMFSRSALAVVQADILSSILRHLKIERGDKFTYKDARDEQHVVFFGGFTVFHGEPSISVRRVLMSGKPGKDEWFPNYDDIVEISKEGVCVRVPK